MCFSALIVMSFVCLERNFLWRTFSKTLSFCGSVCTVVMCSVTWLFINPMILSFTNDVYSSWCSCRYRPSRNKPPLHLTHSEVENFPFMILLRNFCEKFYMLVFKGGFYHMTSIELHSEANWSVCSILCRMYWMLCSYFKI